MTSVYHGEYRVFSTSGTSGLRGLFVYSQAEFAHWVAIFLRSFARLGRHGITCNAIVPGIIGTEAFHMASPAMNEPIASRTVFKRPGEPQDIANAIAFLCSDLAGYITAIELNVSGGVELLAF
jgi:3-oxoacyl-[acyl-carrier protein] reductase